MKKTLPQIEEFFVRKLKDNDYLSRQAEPGYIDIHCFPLMERLILLENSPWH